MVAHHSWNNGQPGEIFHGIPREPHDFIAEAIDKEHPRDIIAKVSPTVRALLRDLAGEMVGKFCCCLLSCSNIAHVALDFGDSAMQNLYQQFRPGLWWRVWTLAAYLDAGCVFPTQRCRFANQEIPFNLVRMSGGHGEVGVSWWVS